MTDISLQLKGLCILVVDDEADLCDILAEFLEDFGARVLKANSAEEALKKFSHEVNVVLTDIKMPGYDGVHLLKEIKSRSTIPVFLVSGYTDLDAHQARQLGAADLIAKPYQIQSVVKALLPLVKNSASR